MPARRLALLCLASCAPAVPDGPSAPVPEDSSPHAAAAAAVPDGRSNIPVPEDSPAAPPAPKASLAPLRLLHANVRTYAPLADGGLLVTPGPTWVEQGGDLVPEGDTSLQRLDAATGALTPWSQEWSPAAAGWRLRRGSDVTELGPEVSDDGRLVALGHAFELRGGPPGERNELVAIVVSRSDGSEPRCVGVGVPSDDPPPFYWSRDSRRLIGDWSLACSPDARARPVSLSDADPGEWPGRMRWQDLVDGRGGELPYHWVWEGRDPLGDRVVADFSGPDGSGLEIFDLATGATLTQLVDPPAEELRNGRWVADDAVLIDVTRARDREYISQRLVYTDGRSVAITGPRWQIYTRLPDGQLLMSRDGGVSVEQGRVDWTRLHTLQARPRPELARFTSDRQLPAQWQPGLGGVLIHEPDEGTLYLAAI
ncbi:MAG: hypothetical protein IPO88_03505 [Nannocystis sp.]|uniref:hypothetical protein n=1 Tax=Nannocystis sp. TaxID=1962667 RepID=UPI0024292714|nr:hypothetical protein [Nannocystis sp.]MBK9752569.1 hypothetical protein [Nannocystis sp.]